MIEITTPSPQIMTTGITNDTHTLVFSTETKSAVIQAILYGTCLYELTMSCTPYFCTSCDILL